MSAASSPVWSISFVKSLPLHAAVAGDKRDDPVLDPFEIVKGLADTDDRPGQADRVDGHGRGGRDEGDLGRHRQGHPMECPPPSTKETVGFRMLEMSSEMASPASMSPPHRVEQDKQSVHLVALLHRGQQGHDMFIFCGFAGGGQDLVPLDLSHNGERVDGPLFRFDGGGAHIHDLLLPAVSLLGVLPPRSPASVWSRP